MATQECAVCAKRDEEVYRLVKCPSCYRVVCDACAVRYNGRYFCTISCGKNYFSAYVEDE
jgi:hypothetical protein